MTTTTTKNDDRPWVHLKDPNDPNGSYTCGSTKGHHVTNPGRLATYEHTVGVRVCPECRRSANLRVLGATLEREGKWLATNGVEAHDHEHDEHRDALVAAAIETLHLLNVEHVVACPDCRTTEHVTKDEHGCYSCSKCRGYVRPSDL